MTLVLVLLFVLTAIAGTGVVLSRDPRRQVLALSANGLVLYYVVLASTRAGRTRE
jgi:energy-converting hydrogenase B subunit D